VEKTSVEADLSPPELRTDKTFVGAHVPLPVIDVDERDHEATSASARAELVDVDLEATKTIEMNTLRAASRPSGIDTSEVKIEFAANRAEKEKIDTSETVSGLAPLRVPTQSKIDIDRELSNLREMAFGTARARKKKGPKKTRRCWSKAPSLSKSQPEFWKRRPASSSTSSSWVTTPTTPSRKRFEWRSRPEKKAAKHACAYRSTSPSPMTNPES